MLNILLCSSNQILVKSIYCLLRDAGHRVEVVEHPSSAVQQVLRSKYDVVLIDSDPFGLSAEDASAVIKSVAPVLPILFIDDDGSGLVSTPGSVRDLEELTRALHAITA